MHYGERDVPVLTEADVLVVGGGTSGMFAGIAAADTGASALILEQAGRCGGMATRGLVTPVCHNHMPGNPPSSYIAPRLEKKLLALGATYPVPVSASWFDPVRMTAALEELMLDSGCRILYGATLVDVLREGGALTAAIVKTDGALWAVPARRFIDATGDAYLSHAAGVKCLSGNGEGFNQAVSLRFIMGGVDTGAFRAYLTRLGETHPDTERALETECVQGNYAYRMTAVLEQGVRDGLLTAQDAKYFQCYSLPGRPHDIAFNCPELGATRDNLRPDYRTDRLMEGRRAILRLTRFLRLRVDGFAQAYPVEIADALGVRDSRRVVCEYTLTAQDIARRARFDDYIATSNYPVDVHSAGDDASLQYDPSEQGPEAYYHIPMRSLVAAGIDNLAVCGRLIGADFAAQASVRVQHTCRATGEAAGIACALSCAENAPIRKIDGARVRDIMLSRGAVFTSP